MSDTPRTDAATFKATRIGSALSENVVCVDDAKRLEAENAAILKALRNSEKDYAALRKVIASALEDVCGAKLCYINSMSSRREMVRLLEKATDTLRAAKEEKK